MMSFFAWTKKLKIKEIEISMYTVKNVISIPSYEIPRKSKYTAEIKLKATK
jgi:hypothetical protein